MSRLESTYNYSYNTQRSNDSRKPSKSERVIEKTREGIADTLKGNKR